jgi:hypothetical protein
MPGPVPGPVPCELGLLSFFNEAMPHHRLGSRTKAMLICWPTVHAMLTDKSCCRKT